MEDLDNLVPRINTINLVEEDEEEIDLQGTSEVTAEVEPGFNWRLALVGQFIQT